MSTLKSDGIQPTLNTNNLIIRSGADVERLRIQPNGQILVASTTGTTFAGEVNFSNTVRLPGGVQVGGGIGPTRYTALDVVHTNTGLGLPDAVNYNTTRSRSNMMIQASGTNTTLFFGNNSSTHAWLQVQNSDNNPYGLMLNPAGGSVIVGSFAGDTNVMVKPTNAAGTVGQVVPLFTWGGNIGTATVERNHTAPIPSGTWLVVLSGISETNGGGASYVAGTENKTLSMAQTWVVPSEKYLVFAHSDQSNNAASASTSGLAWKLINASDVASYRPTSGNLNPFPPGQITSVNGWNNICKTNGTAQLINEQNADTATGGDKQASGCVYQGGGGWGVTIQVTGYAIRIS